MRHPNQAVEAARIADALHQLALDANRLTIALRGTDAVSNANMAFVSAASAAARAAEVVKILSFSASHFGGDDERAEARQMGLSAL